MPPAPESLHAIAQRVESRLLDLLDHETKRWNELDPEIEAPLKAVRQLVTAGGKRLRPAFCYWGFIGAGGDDADAIVVDAGAAFELLHAFALFHDDVMDGASTRRGERATHLVYADDHEAGNWAGEARRFGEGVAILVGDLAFVYADMLLRAAPATVWDVWNELRVELNVGQYLDILGSARRERSGHTARRIARYKSGKYTVERPLHLGALLAAPDCGPAMLEALSAYGLPLGDAFQFRDDVLGAFGNEEMTGKPVGDDLREGKPTPLLSIAVAQATPAQRAVLDRVGTPTLTVEEIATIQQVLVDTGALAQLEDEITRLTGDALAALDVAPIDAAARDALGDLARYVAWRDA